MIMENYSPSHPTDDMDIDDSDEISPKDRTEMSVPKVITSKENDQVSIAKPTKTIFGDDLNEINDIESSAWVKELNSNEPILSSIDSKSQRNKSPQKVVKRSRSKSVEKRSISKTGFKRSRSRSGNKRSRSRNRRSRSRSGHRRRRSRSGQRRSTSRSDSRNQRSRSGNRTSRNDSRNGSSRSYGRDNDTRKLKSRSKSPRTRIPLINRDTRKNEPNINSRSPENRSISDRNDDNIFNKLTELRTLPVTDSPKEKWGCDSDEETTPAVVRPVQSTFSDNRNRSDNFSERFSRDRQDFGDRRGRGFQRGAPWSQGRSNNRNDNTGDRNSRNQQWGQPRQGFGNNWGSPKASEKSNERVVTPNTMSKNNYDSEEESQNWGKNTETIIKEPSSVKNMASDVKGDRFAENSDEEFGKWGKESKDDSSPVRDMPVDTNLPTSRVIEDNRQWGNDNRTPQHRGPSSLGNSEGGFSAWKSAQKTDAAKAPQADKFADNSDEEFGAWGNELKKTVVVDKPGRNAVDSDDEYGTWNSEQRTTKPVEESFDEAPRDDDQFSQDSRVGFQSRGGGYNQFGSRRGGTGAQRNFGNTRFQRPPNQDRYYNNTASNYHNNDNAGPNIGSGGNGGYNQFSGGYNSNYNNVPQMAQPNYNYKPPQLPQWATQPQNNPYQTRPQAGQMPFQFDASVCPPPMNMIPPQMHPSSVQMMQRLPFIPPPPPNMSLDNRGPPPMNSANMMALLGGLGHSDQSDQSSMGVGQSVNINQSTMSIAQNTNASQSGLTMNPNVGQSAINMVQNTNLRHSQSIVTVSNSFNQPIVSNMGDSNLLETLMTKAGLSSESLRMDKKPDSTMSINDQFNSILKNAASSVFSRLVESNIPKPVPPISDNMSMSPPSPPSNSPPPALLHAAVRYPSNPTTQETIAATFVPPPLPNYSDILKPSTNKMSLPVVPKADVNSIADEEKRNRSDFESKIDWQERVAQEVKVFLKPAYMSRNIDKNDYKEIMKRCVTKITRSGVAEINSDKIEKFVLSYVDKYNKNRKVKQHSTVSSSEHDLRCD